MTEPVSIDQITCIKNIKSNSWFLCAIAAFFWDMKCPFCVVLGPEYIFHAYQNLHAKWNRGGGGGGRMHSKMHNVIKDPQSRFFDVI